MLIFVGVLDTREKIILGWGRCYLPNFKKKFPFLLPGVWEYWVSEIVMIPSWVAASWVLPFGSQPRAGGLLRGFGSCEPLNFDPSHPSPVMLKKELLNLRAAPSRTSRSPREKGFPNAGLTPWVNSSLYSSPAVTNSLVSWLLLSILLKIFCPPLLAVLSGGTDPNFLNFFLYQLQKFLVWFL